MQIFDNGEGVFFLLSLLSVVLLAEVPSASAQIFLPTCAQASDCLECFTMQVDLHVMLGGLVHGPTPGRAAHVRSCLMTRVELNASMHM